jgi:chromosome partitioning protein
MTGAVISIAQQKGGAGKTTLAIQLAIAWLAKGKRVAMLDIDPQGSLAAWAALRRVRLGEPGAAPAVQSLSGWRLGNEVPALRRSYDLVLIDSPPHAETDAKTAIRQADLVLLPCQPNALDVWATEPTLSFAQDNRTAALLVLNRVPARSRAAEAIQAAIAEKGWPLAKARLGNRQAYAASINEGQGVAELAPASPAGQEIEALAKEVARKLR